MKVITAPELCAYREALADSLVAQIIGYVMVSWGYHTDRKASAATMNLPRKEHEREAPTGFTGGAAQAGAAGDVSRSI